jgi:hypothetical protein
MTAVAAVALALRPDPEHPAGGFAVLSMPAIQGAPTVLTVAVSETFGDRWLAPSAADASGGIGAGDANWQAVAHPFGPYRLRPADDRLEAVIGPEIVNKIEGYTQLKLLLSDPAGAWTASGSVTWPDDIAPLAGARGAGGLQVRRRPEDSAELRPRLRADAPGNAAAILPVADAATQMSDPPAGDAAETVLKQPPRPRSMLLPLLLVLCLAAAAIGAGGRWWFSRPDAAATAVVPAAPEATPAPAAALPEAAANPCSLPAPADLTADLSALRGLVAECAGVIGPDGLMRAVEDAADAGNAEALLVIARLYDSAQTDPDFETAGGIVLSDKPDLAAAYYARAAEAGATEATPLLQNVCARLAEAQDTLSQEAIDDFCR